MANELRVENQCFAFGNTWNAFKYDDSAFYHNQVERNLKATKAVDIVADLPSENMLLLLEAKDFRGHRIENRHRLQGELAEEVALKVRDTVAALLGAGRSGVTEFDSAILEARLLSKERIAVVLWVEDDTSSRLEEWKVRLKVLSDQIKKHLMWLGPRKVHVLSMKTVNALPDLVVTSLPRAGSPS